jgi:hypothetical protein
MQMLDKGPSIKLPPKRGIVVGTGRCGTWHITKLYSILFPEYIWASHEVYPTYSGKVGEIYDEKDFTSNRTKDYARRKWRDLMQRRTRGGGPIHRWLEASAFMVPFIFHLLSMDKEMKLIVMIRHPADFHRSCTAMLESSKDIKGFIWDRIEHQRFKHNYIQYWLECYQAIRNQLHWLHREPDLVMFTDAYGEGSYTKQLLHMWDIPETKKNKRQLRWFCENRALNAAENREVWDSAEVPNIEMCKPEWDWWWRKYAWMVEKEE